MFDCIVVTALVISVAKLGRWFPSPPVFNELTVLQRSHDTVIIPNYASLQPMSSYTFSAPITEHKPARAPYTFPAHYYKDFLGSAGIVESETEFLWHCSATAQPTSLLQPVLPSTTPKARLFKHAETVGIAASDANMSVMMHTPARGATKAVAFESTSEKALTAITSFVDAIATNCITSAVTSRIDSVFVALIRWSLLASRSAAANSNATGEPTSFDLDLYQADQKTRSIPILPPSVTNLKQPWRNTVPHSLTRSVVFNGLDSRHDNQANENDLSPSLEIRFVQQQQRWLYYLSALVRYFAYITCAFVLSSITALTVNDGKWQKLYCAVNGALRANCNTAQSLASSLWPRCVDYYSNVIDLFILCLPAHINSPSNHDASTGWLEPRLIALPYVGTGNIVACAVPELSTTIPKTAPMEQSKRGNVARQCLVSVSSLRCSDKVYSVPSSSPQTEKDGVDHKDTFAFAFKNEDPWASHVANTLLEIEELALSPPLKESLSVKPGQNCRRDDDGAVRRVRFAEIQECMPANQPQSDTSHKENLEQVFDLGTRVANLMALGRFQLDSMRDIFEECDQAEDAVSFLTAEVGLTEKFRRYEKEIEYVQEAADWVPQPKQIKCRHAFESEYRDANLDVLHMAGGLQDYALRLIKELRTCKSEHLDALRKNARQITVPEISKIQELIELFFENRKSSARKELTSIEVCLKLSSEIHAAALEKMGHILNELLRTISDLEKYCQSYFDASENHFAESDPKRESNLLTQLVIAYRLLPE